MEFIHNGAVWRDTDGNVICAHGGCMLKVGEYFYWYGENRTGDNRVACYRSKNLRDWEFRNNVLTVNSPFRPVRYRTHHELKFKNEETGVWYGATIERPKVIYNAETKKYVMWMHWENGRNYSDARCAVATCDTPEGDFVYHGSFNPLSHMSRDCTLFVDDDGTAYFISATRDNADLNVFRLSDDYLNIDELVRVLWPGEYREAPVLIKRNGIYYLFSSECTGWYPNQGAYGYSDSIDGRWSRLYNFGDITTFDTQPAFPLVIRGTKRTSYFYVGDRWDPADYSNSRYIILPIEFDENDRPFIKWASHISIDTETGEYITENRETNLFRIASAQRRYFTDEDGEIKGIGLSYENEGQKWSLEETETGRFAIKSALSGKYITESGGTVALSDSPQPWKIEYLPDGRANIISEGGKYLTWTHAGEQHGWRRSVHKLELSDECGWRQLFIVQKVF